jgi:hypothetical protein
LFGATAGKNAGFLKGIVSLVKVAHGDDGLRVLAEGCDEVGRVILKEHNGQAIVEDKGDRPVELAGCAWVETLLRTQFDLTTCAQ